MGARKKCFYAYFAIVFLLPFLFLFVGCDSNKNNGVDNTNSNISTEVVTITFNIDTTKGELSRWNTGDPSQFSFDQFKGIKITTNPDVTAKDNYYFEYWADEAENEFNFDSVVTKNLSLHAVFDVLEPVVCDTWQKGKSLSIFKGFSFFDYRDLETSTSLSTQVFTNEYKNRQIQTTLVPHKQIKDEYITLDEFSQLSNKNVFTTDATEERILTENDITSNVCRIVSVV